jgi:hypothetical protein
MHQQNTIKTRTGHPSAAARHSAPFRGHKNRQMRCCCTSYKRRKLCGQSFPVSRQCSHVQETVAAMGKITYENAPNFVAAEAEIVRICSTNWVKKVCTKTSYKRTQLNVVIVCSIHVQSCNEPWQCWPILTTTTLQPAGDNFSEEKAAGTCSWPGILINSKEKNVLSSVPLKDPSYLTCCAV